jgi:hypothetical protein
MECYEEAGYPTIYNEKVKIAVDLIKKLYDTPNGSVGGIGHVVFDDWNLDCVKSCLAECGKDWTSCMCQDTIDASRKALEHCVDMTEDELASALAIVDGFWKP